MTGIWQSKTTQYRIRVSAPMRDIWSCCYLDIYDTDLVGGEFMASAIWIEKHFWRD